MSKSGPNKTVARARRAMGGFPAKPPKPSDAFIDWVAEQARAGASFKSADEAREAFVRAKGLDNA